MDSVMPNYVETERTWATEDEKVDTWIGALQEERDGYARAGMKDLVAQVDAEIQRFRAFAGRPETRPTRRAAESRGA